MFAQRGAENRLGLALTLCGLRFLGFVPEDLASAPEEALGFVAGQVDAASRELLSYGARAQTRSDHLAIVLGHLGWRRASSPDRQQLARWLVARAVEHDAPSALIALAGEHLRARRILRPSLEALSRMVATARGDAYREVEELMGDQLSPGRRTQLDTLLDGGAGQSSQVADLLARAKRTGVSELLGQVGRYRRLVALGALQIDVGVLPPVRRRSLEERRMRSVAERHHPRVPRA